MLNTNRYAIDNRKLVGRLMPFFTNGRKLMSFILACLHPLESTHLEWRNRAFYRLAEAMATSQPIVLRWYLTKVFQPYFVDKSKVFTTSMSEPEQYIYVFENDMDEQANGAGLQKWWTYEDGYDMASVARQNIEGELAGWMYVIDETEFDSDESATLNVYAPQQINSLDNDTYINLIRQQIEKYLVYDDVDYIVNIVN